MKLVWLTWRMALQRFNVLVANPWIWLIVLAAPLGGLLFLNGTAGGRKMAYLFSVFMPGIILILLFWMSIWLTLFDAQQRGSVHLTPYHRKTVMLSALASWLLNTVLLLALAVPLGNQFAPLMGIFFGLIIGIPLATAYLQRGAYIAATLAALAAASPAIWPGIAGFPGLPLLYAIGSLAASFHLLHGAGIKNVQTARTCRLDQLLVWWQSLLHHPRHPVDLAYPAACGLWGTVIFSSVIVLELVWYRLLPLLHGAQPDSNPAAPYSLLIYALIMPTIELGTWRSTLLKHKSAQAVLSLAPQAGAVGEFNRRLALAGLRRFLWICATVSVLALLLASKPSKFLLFQHCAYYLPALCVLAAPLTIPDFSRLQRLGWPATIALYLAPFLLPAVFYWQPAEIEFWVVNALCIVAGIVLTLRRLDQQQSAPLAFPVGYRSDGLLRNARTPQP